MVKKKNETNKEAQPQEEVYSASQVTAIYQQLQSKIDELLIWKLRIEKVVASHGESIKFNYAKMLELNEALDKSPNKKK